MRDLSVLIPARSEEWLGRTVADVLEHRTADTEVIVVLDGAWPTESMAAHPDVQVIHRPKSIGQRAATNLAARLSTARYVMKLDAHCAVAPGFDSELIRAAEELGPDVTQIPAQWNLHVYDLVCEACGKRTDQAPHLTVCSCGAASLRKEVVWERRTQTTAWRFDADLHFQYAGEMSKRAALRHGDFIETMSCLGACWFMSRARYWELGGLDEDHGSWGQMGTEIGCKSWLSGGRMVTNTRTWFAHFFRVGGIGFPYEIHGSEQDRAREYSRNLWRKNKWPGQKRPLSWLIEHFAPVPGWEGKDAGDPVRSGSGLGDPPDGGSLQRRAVDRRLPSGEEGPSLGIRQHQRAQGGAAASQRSKGIVYYSDCRGDTDILEAAKRQLLRATNGHSIVSVTLAPIDLGRNIVLPLERGHLTMFRQILAGLEASDADIVFLAEHDVLYHPSHFDFVPPRDDVYYYNVNTWKVDAATGRALHYITEQTSGLCAYRSLLVEHYRERVARVEREGFQRSIGFEPGKHKRPRGVDDHGFGSWMSAQPNVDIRHGFNLTRNRWSRDQFRDQRCCEGWTEADDVPGWGVTRDRFPEWLREVTA